MAINFGKPVLSTTTETKRYQQMSKIDFSRRADYEKAQDIWQGRPINFGRGENRIVLCSATYFDIKPALFTCSLGYDDRGPQFLRDLVIPRNQNVKEIRYGDIDRDGDVDIAVELTKGAIYVFHNLANK